MYIRVHKHMIGGYGHLLIKVQQKRGFMFRAWNSGLQLPTFQPRKHLFRVYLSPGRLSVLGKCNKVIGFKALY